MRDLDPAFEQHLKSGATTLATCWKLTRRDGVTLGFTDHDRILTFDGVDFLPDSGADGAALSESADLAVDNTEIAGALSADALSAEDLAAGRYDGAHVEIWRVNWTAPEQRLHLKTATIGEVVREGRAFRAELRGPAHALGQTRGRVYQRSCDVNLGSAPCGVDLDDPAFRADCVIADIVDEQSFLVTGFLSFAEGWFTHGLARWVSGANAGTVSHIKRQGGAAMGLWLPPGKPVAIGDMFVATAGCDKRFATCREKFANGVNFRGFPLTPGDDAVIAYPVSGETHDGGPRRPSPAITET